MNVSAVGMAEAALVYAAHEVPVFPVWGVVNRRCLCGRYPCGDDNRNAGKHPLSALVPHGFKEATTDRAIIRGWWTRHPLANIGTPTTWATVLDVDPRHGGDVALAELERRHGALPETPEVLTGGGGRHVYFQPSALACSSGKIGPGLDVKSAGGYVLLPPSNHVSGGVYLDEVVHPLFETALAAVPAWLQALASAPTNGHASEGVGDAREWASLLAGTPHGERHAVATRIAGHYLGKHLPMAEVREILLGFAARCVPPFPAAEAARIVEDLAAKDLQRAAAGAAAASSTPAELRTFTFGDLVRGERRPIEYHWPGWIPLAAVALLVGAGESLKSWLALMLAISTAGKLALFDAGVMRDGPVLYITGENAIEEEQRRCQLLQAALGLPDELPIIFLAAESLNLSLDQDYAGVVALVEQLAPVLIVIDSAIAVSGVVEERDNNAVRMFMQRRILPLARRHGATVLVLGHSPKPSQQPGVKFTDEHVARGAGDWRNASDVVLYLRREPSLGSAAVVLRHAKVRIGTRHAPLWFTLDEAGTGVRLTLGGAYDDASAQATGALAKAITAALDVLRAEPGIFSADVVKRLEGAGSATATARRAVGVLRGQAKHPWPHGPLVGKVFAVVDETKEGRRPRLILDPTRAEEACPPGSDEDEGA